MVKAEKERKAGAAGGEKEKAVRKTMLKKLLKYDYRGLFRILVPCYIIVASLAVFSGLSLLVLSGRVVNEWAKSLSMSLISMYSMSIFACVVFSEFLVPIYYYTKLFSKEGYLTLSIPASPEEHILSKLISGVCTSLLSFAVCLFSSLTMMFIGGEATFADIGTFFRKVGSLYYKNPEAFLYTLEILLLALEAFVFMPQVIMCCISLGQLSSKNRIVMAIVAYIVLQAFVQCVLIVVVTSSAFYFLSDFFSAIGVHGFLWFLILLSAGLNVGGFYLQRYILKNKVNLN